jgi:hypothetical protein
MEGYSKITPKGHCNNIDMYRVPLNHVINPIITSKKLNELTKHL